MNFFAEYQALPMGWRFNLHAMRNPTIQGSTPQHCGSYFELFDNILVVTQNEKLANDGKIVEDCKPRGTISHNNNSAKPVLSDTSTTSQPDIASNLRKAFADDDDEDVFRRLDVSSPPFVHLEEQHAVNNTKWNANSPTASPTARSESGRNMNPLFNDSQVAASSESPVLEHATSSLQDSFPSSERRRTFRHCLGNSEANCCDEALQKNVVCPDASGHRPHSNREAVGRGLPIQTPFEHEHESAPMLALLREATRSLKNEINRSIDDLIDELININALAEREEMRKQGACAIDISKVVLNNEEMQPNKKERLKDGGEILKRLMEIMAKRAPSKGKCREKTLEYGRAKDRFNDDDDDDEAVHEPKNLQGVRTGQLATETEMASRAAKNASPKKSREAARRGKEKCCGAVIVDIGDERLDAGEGIDPPLFPVEHNNNNNTTNNFDLDFFADLLKGCIDAACADEVLFFQTEKISENLTPGETTFRRIDVQNNNKTQPLGETSRALDPEQHQQLQACGSILISPSNNPHDTIVRFLSIQSQNESDEDKKKEDDDEGQKQDGDKISAVREASRHSECIDAGDRNGSSSDEVETETQNENDEKEKLDVERFVVPSSTSKEMRALRQAAARHEIDPTKIIDPAKVRFLQEKEHLLGEGSFAKVILVLVGNVEFAAKIFLKESIHDVVSLAFKELGVLSRLDHPNIVQVPYVTSWNGHPVLLMEKAKCDLARYLETHPLSPSQIVDFVHPIAAGLADLHSKDIVHCDLKLSNILVFEDPNTKKITLKLADFGGVVEKDSEGSTVRTNICVTEHYAAPEYHEARENKTERRLNASFDVFSFGVILLKLLAKTQYDSKETKGEAWRHQTLKEIIHGRVTTFAKGGDNNPMKQPGACAIDIQNVKLEADISQAMQEDEDLRREIDHLMEICRNCLMMNKGERLQNGSDVLQKWTDLRQNQQNRNYIQTRQTV